MIHNRNFGAWVIEHPTEAQLAIFNEANFPLSQACFAPPELMQKAGAKYYPNRRSCHAIKTWISSNPPQLMFRLKGKSVWVLHNPSEAQLEAFKEAGQDVNRMRFWADEKTMEKVGATLHPDINVVPEVVSVLFAPPTDDERVGGNVVGWPKTGGVWALIGVTMEQIVKLRELGYDFGTYDSEDKWHVLLEQVGAKFYKNPEDIKDEVEKGSPGFELMPPGTRGGIAQ